MLSATADYALRAVLVLARSDSRRPMRADEIAAAIGAPRNYMAKTLNALAKAGITHSARGPLGGFVLAVAPDALTVGRIADVFGEPRRPAICLLGSQPCNPLNPCLAHRRWTAASDEARHAITALSVAELLGEPAA